MFKNKPFYHEHLRKIVISFGSLFNNLYIRRRDADGNVAQPIAIPLSYGPKQKMISRILEVDTLEEGRGEVQITLPRMGFEISRLEYDSSRKLVVTQPVRSKTSAGVGDTFISTPYNVGMTLGIFAKNQDDALQILEQILPFFNPDFNVTITELPDLNIKRDIQFILQSVRPNITYESEMGTRTLVIWELDFVIKANFFGFVSDTARIRRVIQNIFADLTATAGGTKITTEVSPFDAEPESDWTFIQEFDLINNE